jgi:hypothetical protein
MKYWFKKFKVNEDLKDTYVLLNYACYNHNISKFQCEVDLNTILTNHFQMYFYYYDIYLFISNFVCNLL